MWRNWSGYVECPDATIVTPCSGAELTAALAASRGSGKKLRVVGGGHSFSPLVATDGNLLSLDRLQGVIEIDAATRTARVHAGTRLWAISNALAAAGLAMENLGDINVQSIAGAVSTGTHGTGITLGNLATQVAGFKILTAASEEITATPEATPELFAGGRIALGSLGIFTEMTLRLIPSFRLRLEHRKMTLDDCLAQNSTFIRTHRSFEFFYLPHTEWVMTRGWALTDEPAERAGWQRYIVDTVLENTIFGMMCGLGKAMPSLCPALSRMGAGMIFNNTRIDESHQSLSAVRSVRFNEMEWAVPAERGADALREIKAFIERKEFPMMFPLEYRWVRGDDLWLSPNYGRDSVHISCHQYRGMAFERYFDGVQAICCNHGGRPHWGKMHSLTAPQLAKIYPRWDDFLALRERMDPDGLFLTPYLRRLFGV